MIAYFISKMMTKYDEEILEQISENFALVMDKSAAINFYPYEWANFIKLTEIESKQP